MSDTYCLACLVSKERKHFTIWDEDKTKGRRCDSCHDDLEVRERRRKSEAESRKNRVELTPELKKLSKDLETRHRLDVKKRLDDIQYAKDLAEFEDLI